MRRKIKCCICGKEVYINNYGIKAKKNKKQIFFPAPLKEELYKCSICRGNTTPKKSKLKKVVENEKTKS